jgi:hypothetical protein
VVLVIDSRTLVDRSPIPVKDEPMTYHCPECVTNWHPYQCTDGACPECATGTRRTSEPASEDADVRHRAALAARIGRERRERFEAYYAEREQRRFAA